MRSLERVNKIFPSQRNMSMQFSIFKMFVCLSENIPAPEQSKESDSMSKGIKYCVAYNLVEMEFLSNRYLQLF